MPYSFSFSVTELAEFCCKTGHLDGFSVSGPSAQEGTLGHQWLQSKRKQENSDYNSERLVEYKNNWREHNYHLRGRIDGFLLKENAIWLEEIKTTYVDPDLLAESAKSAHIAQLKLYSAMVALEFPVVEIESQTTWLRLPAYELFSYTFQWSREELKSFLLTTIEKYCDWLLAIYSHRESLQKQCRELQFPFNDFRPYQREICAEVFRTIRSKANLVFEAPTGVGKSISTLFPSFKAIGEEFIEQIIFLTAKQSGRIAAVETIDLLSKNNIQSKCLSLSAKDSVCFCSSNNDCMQAMERGDGTVIEVCKYRLNFFNKLPEALSYCFSLSNIDQSRIMEVAEKFQVCPFSLSLQLIPWFDVIVCDFNYVFDPLVKLSHFESHGRNSVVLVDESHNLIDRSRQMYSAELHEDAALKLMDSSNHKSFFTKQVNRISSIMVSLETLTNETSSEWAEIKPTSEQLNSLKDKLKQIMSDVSGFLNDNTFSEQESAWLKQVIRMNVILDLSSAHHRFFIKSVNNNLLNSLQIKLMCMNASEYLEELYKHSRSLIFFSGTLRPERYIRKTLGIDSESKMIFVPGIFKSEQMKVLISSKIDTRYSVRHQFYEAIADDIYEACQAKKGNYLAAFPSYQFLRNVYQIFIEKYHECNTLLQERTFSSEAKKAFVERFFDEEELLGFVILGGAFTEGIDFKGEALIGMIVVGVGLPMVNSEQEALKNDFENSGLNGFQLAYQFPGLHRVLQTAGRVIRQVSDRGVLVLLDKRFLNSQYREHFPSFWNVESYASSRELKHHLHDFWDAQ
ncbi:MAG: ATP-dependent DNA helicase [Gammaproteobacteria bacterium]|nr:ATP-dependent DNA helicase [Gammaproteobacteria bacterium]